MRANAFRRAYHVVADAEGLDLAARLTFVLLLFSDWVVGPDWRFKLPLRTIAIVGLVAPPLHRSQSVWLLLTFVMGWKTVWSWWTQDNHAFLVTYWCLAVYLSLTTKDCTRTLAASGRVLIGLSFAFAALWKVALSKDFLDGTYFDYLFLTDVRFQNFGALFAGMTNAAYQHNAAALAQLDNPGRAVEAVQLEGTSALLALARMSAWWTAAIESALAALFLLPTSMAVSRHRHAFLLLFAWTTYLIASVEPFGWILMTIGVGQCEPEQRRIRVLYVATGLLIMAYTHVPVLAPLRSLLGR